MEVCRGLLLIAVLMVIDMQGRGSEAQLVEGFYNTSCPKAEAIVKEAVIKKLDETFTTSPATLRLFFHDCFVEGCDASVMIQSPNQDAEKDAPDNLSLAGDAFDTVIRAKIAVEKECPGVVSCADILTIATRDVVLLGGGPDYKVELGRRDGLISQASRVHGNLPEPEFDLKKLNDMFAKHNLTQTDVVALSGAHTLGFSHCDRFDHRIYSFKSPSGIDPTMNPEYANHLKEACPKGVDPSAAIELDVQTPRTFDNKYFQNLVDGKGLLTSDQVLFTDPASKPVVVNFANNNEEFNRAFVTAMTKLGRVGVKTGKEGEIRKDCTLFNEKQQDSNSKDL